MAPAWARQRGTEGTWRRRRCRRSQYRNEGEREEGIRQEVTGEEAEGLGEKCEGKSEEFSVEKGASEKGASEGECDEGTRPSGQAESGTRETREAKRDQGVQETSDLERGQGGAERSGEANQHCGRRGFQGACFLARGSSWRGRHLGRTGRQAYVLYFYPKDDTPGCTKEACDFRGWISGLSGRRHHGARRQSRLQQESRWVRCEILAPVPAACRPGQGLANAYGAWAPSRNYGREYMGIIRSTFVVGADGRVLAAYRGVKVDGHVQKVLARALEGAA